MQTKNSKLKTRRECDVVYTALNRLYKLCQSYETVDEVRFAIMLMKTQIHETEQLIEIEDLRKQVENFNWWVENYMTCKWGPCHKCHHLYNGCYEPTKEMVEEIRRRYESDNIHDTIS